MALTQEVRVDLSRTGVRIASAVITFVILESLVLAQFLLAYRDGLLTYNQMNSRGLGNGLPLVWHFGVWSDGLMLSGLLAWLVFMNARAWRLRSIVVASTAALVITLVMTWTYTSSPNPEGHVLNHALTAAGWLHTAYMWMALTIILAFFFCESQIPSRYKAVVSWLLFCHVLVGTHMLLGLLNVNNALPWYQRAPLKSLAGWAIVGVVAISLLVVNLGIEPIYRRAASAVRVIGSALLWIQDQQPSEAKGYLKFLDYLVDATLAMTAFFLIIYTRWVAGADVLSIVLVFAIAVTWLMSRLSVKQELRIADSLFPSDRFPDDLSPKSRASITLQVLAFTLCYLFLAWYSDSILIVSFCMFLIGGIDFWTRCQINSRFRRYFSDSQFAPDPGERGADVIAARRRVVSWYLFDLPHLRKEVLRTLGFMISFSLALIAWHTQSQVASNGAYLALLAVLIVNELVTLRWRVKRDADLRSAERPDNEGLAAPMRRMPSGTDLGDPR